MPGPQFYCEDAATASPGRGVTCRGREGRGVPAGRHPLGVVSSGADCVPEVRASSPGRTGDTVARRLDWPGARGARTGEPSRAGVWGRSSGSTASTGRWSSPPRRSRRSSRCSWWSAFFPRGSDTAVSDAVIRRFGLTGDAAAAVTVFAHSGSSSVGRQHAPPALFSGVSLTRRMQKMYSALAGANFVEGCGGHSTR